MNHATLHAFISQHRYAVISSLAKNGSPQSALIGIAVSPNLEIIFDTVKSSRKYPNLITNPRCSLVIGWENEQTLQYEGIAIEPTGDELAHYQKIYFATWPDGPARLSWPGLVHLVVRPTWLRYSDFSQSAPQISELTFPLTRQ
ncbi:MAG TPA: pyridoxamine 5'-phosphate oxidase family protein [Candidatus Dormibacteraeota bacterium]|nr:pyridoxamine 5'-phosphate oxidase family protein [Candidatus Dormibacteraeota bacterium]